MHNGKVYSWVSLGNVGAGTITWFWNAPDGSKYRVSVDIPPNPKGGYWPSYNTWSYIDIANFSAQDQVDELGDWSVDVVLNDKLRLTDYFTITILDDMTCQESALTNE